MTERGLTSGPSSVGHRQRLIVLALFIVLFTARGLLVPAVGFGDLWFNTDVSRGAGHDELNLYRGVDRQLDDVYNGLPPGFVAPYGPTYYYPVWVLHRLATAVGLEAPTSCDGQCELERRPLFWGVMAKAPHLLLDAACVLLLVALLPRRTGLRAAIAWIASPALFYVFYLMGQNDVFPLATVVFAFGSAAQKLVPPTEGETTDQSVLGVARSWLRRHGDVAAMVALGLGGSMKMVPLLFAPAFALVLARRPGRAAALMSIAAASMFATALPFLGSDYFVRSFLLSQRFAVLLTTDVAGLSPLLLVLTISALLIRRSRSVGTVDGLLLALVTTSAGISLFTEFNPQRPAYLAAAAAIVAGYVRLPTLVLLGVSALVALHPLTTASLGPGILQHWSTIYADVPAPIELLGRTEYLSVLRLVARAFGVMAAVYLVVVVARRGGAPRAPSSTWMQPLVLTSATAALLVVLAGTVLLGRTGEDSAVAGAPSGDLGGTVARQQFAVRNGAEAVHISVLLDPFNRVPPRQLTGRLLSGCEGAVATLAESSADGLALFDGSPQYVRFDFADLRDPVDGNICFELDLADLDPGDGVGGFLSSKPGAGPLLVDGVAKAGALTMRERYPVPIADVATDVGRRFAREPIVLPGMVLASALLGWFVGRSAWRTTFVRRESGSSREGHG